ncbi:MULTISPECIES: hypothetical protein [Cyanobium]|jgi:hypothetical protein|uniref:hypothetical protein n=1 Tax=Cyanobium TaxID=167375 RepID=UPI00137B43A6|nr:MULTISPECIES: hypothetical protein [Cyanobium]MCP9779325.1 hypothetical protein [Cyanobium sp. To12R1]MCP9783433.1 hypothetical protein [Cyanobium sp. WKJ7-Wakatipu]
MAALWLKAIALNLSISINSTAKRLNEMAPPLQHHFGAHQQLPAQLLEQLPEQLP